MNQVRSKVRAIRLETSTTLHPEYDAAKQPTGKYIPLTGYTMVLTPSGRFDPPDTDVPEAWVDREIYVRAGYAWELGQEYYVTFTPIEAET